MDAEKVNILIFPGGSEIALEINRALKFSKFCNLFAASSDHDHTDFVYANPTTYLPYIDSPNFIDELNKVIFKHKINMIFPAHDTACYIMSKNADKIKAQVLVSEFRTCDICRHKSKTYKFISNEKFIPKYYNNINEITDFPVFLKPDTGQGSKNVHIAKTIEETRTIINKRNEKYVICEYLNGEEYTIDCFTDKNGSLRVCKPRTRDRTKAGISVKSTLITDNDEFLPIANTINNNLNFRGAWFFQLKRNNNNELKLLEIAPRLAGTSGLTRNLGINYPLLTIFDFLNYDLEILENTYQISCDRAFYSAYKIEIKYDYVYLDYDDALMMNNKVNTLLISFLYQCINNYKKIILITKHDGNIIEDLKKSKISIDLFSQIIQLNKDEHKSDYIKERSAIYIDDSFAERKEISEVNNIPVFDMDMVESLINWSF